MPVSTSLEPRHVAYAWSHHNPPPSACHDAVAKALAGGDVTRRETETCGGGRTADFYYNTGQFRLQPIAETPEAIYRLITDAYVNDLKSSPAAALDKMDKADALFEGWLAAVRASS